jgi:hypothetical protein
MSEPEQTTPARGSLRIGFRERPLPERRAEAHDRRLRRSDPAGREPAGA